MNKLKRLFDSLHIKPKKYSLYVEALTHPSYKSSGHVSYDYQRLEFLGDAVVEKVVSKYLFDKYPNLPEGELTKIRIMIVQSQTMIMAAKQLNLRDYLILGKGMEENFSEKILEDVFEALMAAIFIDLGEKEVYHVLKRTIIHLYEIHYLDKRTLDYKSLFQEAIQRYGKKRIKYECRSFVKDGIHQYKVDLWSNDIHYGVGYGTKKKEAEKNAAMNAYNKLAK